VTFTLLLLTAAAAGAEPPAVEARRADPPGELSAAVRAAVGPEACTLGDAAGTWATLWLRPALPVRATPVQVRNGLTPKEVPPGTLVGAVRLARPWTDFRKQTVPPGVYTLRLAVQPLSDDHAGTAPHPEFLLLLPAAADTKADTLDPDDAVELSAKANGKHPSVVLVVPALKAGEMPKWTVSEGGFGVLEWGRSARVGDATGPLGWGLVLGGHSPKAR
jgi:hypothetical protein